MPVLVAITLLLGLLGVQDAGRPPYVSEGDRVEQQFRAHRDRLDRFFVALRGVVTRDIPGLLPELQGAPPQAVRYGYQLVPKIVDDPPLASLPPTASFTYSWPVTQGYVEGEGIKLARAESELRGIPNVDNDEKSQVLLKLVREYRTLVQNQRTIDQYVQYNRFWQRAVADDKPRFERMTNFYNLMVGGSPDAAEVIREALGRPEPPSFINVVRDGKRIVLRVPIYTDIEDDAFLAKAKATIEDWWQATEGGTTYSTEVEIRKATRLYPAQDAPQTGDHINLTAHVARFPKNGAVLTTAAESTHAIVGRYIALGPGDLSLRTLAHEFGHLLGFRDGYIRGFKDLGQRGFEILELTPAFDDLMSAPRQGRVQATHFKLILDAME